MIQHRINDDFVVKLTCADGTFGGFLQFHDRIASSVKAPEGVGWLRYLWSSGYAQSHIDHYCDQGSRDEHLQKHFLISIVIKRAVGTCT